MASKDNEESSPKKRGRKPKSSKRKLSESGNESNVPTEINSTTPRGNALTEDKFGKYQKFSKEKQWKLVLIPHSFLPSFNVSKFTDLDDVRDLPLMEVSLPHSVYVSSTPPNEIDICHRRTMAMNTHDLRLKVAKSSYLSAKKKSKVVRKNEKNGFYVRSFWDYAMRRELNPDKYFGRDYDFYYTNGNLCANKKNNQILHTHGVNMERITISLFSSSDGQPDVYPISTVDLSEEAKECPEIFEIQLSSSDSNTFLVRKKFCISVMQYFNDQFYSVRKFRCKSVPFISFAQNKAEPNHLAISNLAHQLRIYDLETSAALQNFKMMPHAEIKPETTWNVVKSWDKNLYLYATTEKISLIDDRIPSSEWENNYCGFEEANSCNSFCSLTVSNFDNLFYAGSTHKIYCVDKRYMGKNIESVETAVSRWTHQMNSYPLMLATNQYEDCEYVIAQSPLNADLRVIENMRFIQEPDPFSCPEKKPRTELPPEFSYKSPCLPYMPPSLQTVLQEARSEGRCLAPSSEVTTRVKACVTGLTFVGKPSNPYFLTATSNGDLFARHMFNANDESSNLTEADVMTRYEENIFRCVKQRRLKTTDVCAMPGISKVFRCSVLSDVKLAEYELPAPPKRKFLGRWQKSVQTLYKYKDALVNDLLSIWDVEQEEERNFPIKELSQSTVADSNSLVAGWLNTAQDAHSTMINMTMIPMDVFNASTASLCDVTIDETLTCAQPSVEPDFTANTSKSKVAKKKNRYVKGF